MSVLAPILNMEDIYIYVHELFTHFKLLVIESNLKLFNQEKISVRATPAFEPRTYGYCVKPCQFFTFDIWNFPNFQANKTVKKVCNGSYVQGFSSINLSGYELTIRSYENQKEKRKLANKYGGYISTHYATIKPSRKASIYVKDVEKIDKFLRNALSFISGAYISPHIYRGFSESTELCGRIGSIENTPWQTRHIASFFDEHSVSVEQLINCLWQYWIHHKRVYVIENAIN